MLTVWNFWKLPGNHLKSLETFRMTSLKKYSLTLSKKRNTTTTQWQLFMVNLFYFDSFPSLSWRTHKKDKHVCQSCAGTMETELESDLLCGKLCSPCPWGLCPLHNIYCYISHFWAFFTSAKALQQSMHVITPSSLVNQNSAWNPLEGRVCLEVIFNIRLFLYATKQSASTAFFTFDWCLAYSLTVRSPGFKDRSSVSPWSPCLSGY